LPTSRSRYSARRLYDGKRYGVLLDNHGWGTWINTDLFKKGEISIRNTPAANADEFVKMAQKFDH